MNTIEKIKQKYINYKKYIEYQDIIDLDTRKIIKGIIKISHKKLKNIINTKKKIILLNTNQTFDEYLNIIIKNKYSYFPVIHQNYIKGIIKAKDLLKYVYTKKKFFLYKILKPVIIIPENKRVDLLFQKFGTEKHNNIAILINKNAKISGIITINDILKSIFD
ncbi:MAG: CBS domain-containing protein [Arsenophonus sp.]|nr:MAG: CBS domain-containing protein [Arsenophonus sp.]